MSAIDVKNITTPNNFDLTVNTVGSGTDIIFKSNGTQTAKIDQAGNLTLTGTVDGVDIQTLNTAVTANTAKTGITSSQATAITAALPKAGGTMTGDTLHGDNVKAKFGAGNDLQIYHDGGDTYISEVGTGALYIASNEIKLVNAGASENMVFGVEDGTVRLYHDNVKKFETTAAGATVTGTVTATSFAGSGAALTGLASPAITKVTQGFTSETRTVYSYNRDLFANNLNFVGQKQAISFTKDSATTDLLIQWSMSLTQFRDLYCMAVYTGSSGSASNMKRFALGASWNFGDQSNTPLTFTGHAIWTGIGSGSQTWYWSIGRANDAYNSSYTLNPSTTDHASITGQTSSHITVYEGDFS